MMIDICPGCKAQLPPIDGPTHRYIGASAACWQLFTALLNGGEPPLTAAPLNALITDAYAAQHPSVPSPQAIQSVAVHLLALYGVLEKDVAPERATWLRLRPLRERFGPKHERFKWLTPPEMAGTPTVSDIVSLATPQVRADKAQQYVETVWRRWSEIHRTTIVTWYDRYVTPD